MSDDLLVDLLAPRSRLRWIAAQVTAVDSVNNELTVSMLGGSVPRVLVMSSYTAPAVGDTAQCLLIESMGMIALGTIKPHPADPTPPAPTVTTLTPISGNGSGASPWTYSTASLNALAGIPMSQIALSLGSPQPVDPSMQLRFTTGNTAASMEFLQADSVPGGGAVTWIPVPLGWQDLMTEPTNGIHSLAAWAYGTPDVPWPWTAGSGQLRFTTLS